MSDDRNKSLINRLVESINSKDLRYLDEILPDDSIEHSVPPGMPPTGAATKQMIRAMLAAFPDFLYHVESTMSEGDRVAQHLTASGTMKNEFMGMPPTGRHAVWTEMHIGRVAGGKVVEHWASIDQAGMMQQLGLLPPLR